MHPVSDVTALELKEHPAEYSPQVLDAIDKALAEYLPLEWHCEADAQGLTFDHCSPENPIHSDPCGWRDDLARILDPFAGNGSGVDHWDAAGYYALGVELEPEWGLHSPLVITGNAVHLDSDLAGRPRFHALVTSPCYGNRMADNHDAKDVCPECNGDRTGPGLDALCSKCGGSGLSRRITYTHTLGRKPSPESAAVLQWGAAYRALHQRFLASVVEVLVDGALVIVNMKNHIRDHREQLVTEWWLNTMLVKGWQLLEVVRVPTPGMGYGANGQARTECEFLLVLRLPADQSGRLAL